MVLETLSKLWRTARALRQIDHETPEKLRVATAKGIAAVKSAEVRVQANNESVAKLAQVMGDRITEATEIDQKKALLRMKIIQEKLDSVKVNPVEVQRKTVEGLLNKWEATLEGSSASNAVGAGTPHRYRSANSHVHPLIEAWRPVHMSLLCLPSLTRAL